MFVLSRVTFLPPPAFTPSGITITESFTENQAAKSQQWMWLD